MEKKPNGIYGTEINTHQLFGELVYYDDKQGVGYVKNGKNGKEMKSFIPKEELYKLLENGYYKKYDKIS